MLLRNHVACSCHPATSPASGNQTSGTQMLGRRTLLAGFAAGAGLLAAGGARAAQPTIKPSPLEVRAVPALGEVPSAAVKLVKRIDVHHHPVPPAYAEAVGPRTGLSKPLVGWSPEKSLADMDRAGVETAMLSVPSNGLWLPDAATNRKIARGCNEFMASLVQKYPGRFGFWATLPLADVEGSMQELSYALDTLHADGIGLLTVYGNMWLGNKHFDPVFAELDRRSTIVFVHPTAGSCCGNLIPGVPEAVIEYGTDTARSIASLLFGGAAGRYRKMKLIFSHAGGTMPALIERFVLQSRMPEARKVLPNGVMPLIRSFYYDTAQAANPEALGALMSIVPESQIVFGTDYPYRTSVEYIAALAGCGLSKEQMIRIGRTNALPLVPKLHKA